MTSQQSSINEDLPDYQERDFDPAPSNQPPNHNASGAEFGGDEEEEEDEEDFELIKVGVIMFILSILPSFLFDRAPVVN